MIVLNIKMLEKEVLFGFVTSFITFLIADQKKSLLFQLYYTITLYS